MTTQPCPIYPEGCHDPQHCVLGSPCVRQEESLAARLASFGLSGSIKVYNQGNAMDEDERMDQIAALVTKWRATRAYDDLSESRLMGLAAIVVSGSTPREWGAGDTIPGDVAVVDDNGGRRWFLDKDPGSDASVWTTAITDKKLVTTFGPVREVSVEGLNPHWITTDQDSNNVQLSHAGQQYRDTLAGAVSALHRAEEVLRYISVKVGVNDAKQCLGAANGCGRTLITLTELTGDES